MGDGADDLTVAGANAKSEFKLGGGNDKFSISDNSDTGFTLYGGDGSDTLAFEENAVAGDSTFDNAQSIENVIYEAGANKLTLGTSAQAAGVTNVEQLLLMVGCRYQCNV